MPRPRTIHDFGASFPKALFDMQYPAPGDPALAKRVAELLAPTPVRLDTDEWGFDHGTWSVLVKAYPQADIPVIQLSLDIEISPAQRLEIGRELAPLRDEGVLIIGSGMSYHNLRELLGGSSRGNDASERFDAWLTQAIEDPDPGARDSKLTHWSEAPGALNAHPRSEHLLPLMVAAGAAGDDRGRRVFNDRIWGKAISGYQFG
jgi:aromatic ring-opening dioxygenase catalytic subunit (LigB family)